MIDKWPQISKFPIYPHYVGTKQPMIVPVKGVIVHSQYPKIFNEKEWSHVWHVWDPPKSLYLSILLFKGLPLFGFLIF